MAAILFVAFVALGQIRFESRAWALDDPAIEQYRKFVLKLDRFNHKLGGCPEDSGADMSRCDPAVGYFDAGLWMELRKDSAKVFR